MSQNMQMKLIGALGSPGCEDLEVTLIKREGGHAGKVGKIWCFNRRVCNHSTIGGKGRYVVEVDLMKVRHPRSRSYISHLFATLSGSEHELSPQMLLKRMKHNKEVTQHVPWLASWATKPSLAISILNRIAGILTIEKYNKIIAGYAEEKNKAMSINLGDHPDDDEDQTALKRNKRAKRRRDEIVRQEKVADLAIRLEESSYIYIGLREFLLFARESELGRQPVLLSLLSSDFKVAAEAEEPGGDGDKTDRRICVLLRRLGYASKKKYSLLRWKGLPPPQPHKAIFSKRPAGLLISKTNDVHPHPTNPILRIALLLTDAIHMRGTVYLMRRVAHQLRIHIHIKECPTVEVLVTELVQNDPTTCGTSTLNTACNLMFIQDSLPGLASDQLKRSLELAKVAVPMVMVAAPETTPPSNTMGESGHNHQLPQLLHALEQDPLQSNENTEEVPWTILSLPFTRGKIQSVFTSFWLPLQQYAWKTIGTKNIVQSQRPPPPSCREFLGKSASDTLSFQHRCGLGRSGIISWYASTQNDIIRNVPNIEKQWMIDADKSLERGAAPLHLGKSRQNHGNSQNVLFSRRVAVQKKQIARRMKEHIVAQSKIVLDLLPRR